jgi:hypothetical protein
MGLTASLNSRSQRVAICLLLAAMSLAKAFPQVGPPPVITVQPLSQVVTNRDPVTFEVVAASATTMSYQWYHDGQKISGAKQSTYTINRVRLRDAGLYWVKVANASGSTTSSNAMLTVLVPPTVATDPQSQTVTVGQSASFAVEANGTAPLSYQWNLGGTAIPDATNSLLALTNVQPSDAGGYAAVITNLARSVTSVVATLTVLVPPTITTDPQSQTVTVGQSTSFAVEASGTAPLSYQWNLGGTAISDATNSVLTLTNVQPSDAGGYAAVVTNLAGSVTSVVATLTVSNSPCTTPPRFGAAAMTVDGFTLQLWVSTGCTYVITASTNLLEWTPVSTNAALSESLEFKDSTATNFRARFYRAAVQ